MDDNTSRMLFEAVQQDIRDGRKEVRYMREEILVILREHRKELDEAKAFRMRLAGAYTVLVIALELGIKFVEHAIK